jgi:hypothetical protein
LEVENPGLSFDELMGTVEDMMGDLFGGVAPSIGHWPSSCAYYSIDVIFDAAEFYDDSSIDEDNKRAETATGTEVASDTSASYDESIADARNYTGDNGNHEGFNGSVGLVASIAPPIPPASTSNDGVLNNGSALTTTTTAKTMTKMEMKKVERKKAKLPQPKLVEINFMGDWKGAEAAAESEEEFHQWVSDLITCLARSTKTPNTERCHRLEYHSG